ncbi:MAG: hypothetical protein JNK85_17455 [Verrucomicrobiales bacterium]|nr:hypothetical protein [Verrucomicrobiales bacterium]
MSDPIAAADNSMPITRFDFYQVQGRSVLVAAAIADLLCRVEPRSRCQAA